MTYDGDMCKCIVSNTRRTSVDIISNQVIEIRGLKLIIS